MSVIVLERHSMHSMCAQHVKHVLALCNKALRKVTVNETSQLTGLNVEHTKVMLCAY